jgi:DNA sulfur modification protein DndD
MIITKLVVQNIGLFKGTHVFDLNPSQDDGADKPIILIGGKNGAGKTTLFQAIRLCLYGNNIGSYKRRQRDYDHYISSIFHRVSGSSLQLDHASVSLEFEYSHLGQRDLYEVQRSWKRHGPSIDESLSVTKNGIEIPDLDPSQWQEFVNELIPPGISQLFFFDGEKIKRLAEHEDDESQLKESFKALLGLNLVEQLATDLTIYSTRQAKAQRDVENTIGGEELEATEANLLEQLERAQQALAQKKALRDQVVGQIERFEERIAQEGGGFAKKRMQRKFEMNQLDHDIEVERNNIRELCSNLFPFALTPKYCNRLKENLLKEEQYLQYQNARKLYDKLTTELSEHIKSSSFWTDLNITKQSQQKLQQKLKDAIEKQARPSSDFRDYVPVHQLSPRDQQTVLAWIHQALNDVPNLLSTSTKKLEDYTRQRRHAESLYNRAPDDDVLSPLMHEIKELSRELGQLEEHIRSDAEEIRQLEWKLIECKRVLDERDKRRRSIEVQSSRVRIAQAVRNVLDEYVTELQESKSKELSELLFQCYAKLSRKVSSIQRIEVSPADFGVTIYEKGGGITPKKGLSVGEKQIYAVSMLWALTIASRRPLPYVIDTPLGRLDSDHRRNLVTEFFPKASHQMIIFSTDTEINEANFSQLQGWISRCYHLSFDADEARTIVNTGYFWGRTEGA